MPKNNAGSPMIFSGAQAAEIPAAEQIATQMLSRVNARAVQMHDAYFEDIRLIFKNARAKPQDIFDAMQFIEPGSPARLLQASAAFKAMMNTLNPGSPAIAADPKATPPVEAVAAVDPAIPENNPDVPALTVDPKTGAVTVGDKVVEKK